MKLNADKENDWHNLGTRQVQFGDHVTCDNALKVCGVQCQVLDHQLTRAKDESEMEEEDEGEGRREEGEGRGGGDEEVANGKVTFLAATKAPAVARNYVII
jgi:hypothetical protein